jgi:uncharacterized protein (TIGR02145 family)
MRLNFHSNYSLIIVLLLQGVGSYSQDTVTIGSQVWMTKNLNVEKFRNGDPIPEARTNLEWEEAGKEGQPAWCYYDNDPSNGFKYGKLYNWYAINDTRGLAPEGWHIPNIEEWEELDSKVGRTMDGTSLLLNYTCFEYFIQNFGETDNDSLFALSNTRTGNEAFYDFELGMFPSEIEDRIIQDSVGTIIGPFQNNNRFYLIKVSERGLNECIHARHIMIRDLEKGFTRIDSIRKIIESNGDFADLARIYSEDMGSRNLGGDLGRFCKGDMVEPFENACYSGEIGDLKVVRTDFGWHLIEILDRGFSYVKIAQIDREVESVLFNIVSGGSRFGDGHFNGHGSICDIWSSSELLDGMGWSFILECGSGRLYSGPSSFAVGASIRCIRD